MDIYAESDYPTANNISAVHQNQLIQISKPGYWGNGTQRLEIAKLARDFGIEAGILEKPLNHETAKANNVTPVIKHLVKTLAIEPKVIDEKFFLNIIDSGLSEEEYTEIIGVVSRITNIDLYARAIGAPLPQFPKPEIGNHSKERPPEAIKEDAWVSTIPNGPAGKEIGKDLYKGRPMPYILRALSLVPDECRSNMVLESCQYAELGRVLDFSYNHYDSLSRPQVEIIAGRVSALNECFY